MSSNYTIIWEMRAKSKLRLIFWGVLSLSLAGNLWFGLTQILKRSDMKVGTIGQRYVRFYPVCYNGEYEPIKGELTQFAHGWFLTFGLPTMVDRKGHIWVPPKYHWARDRSDTVLNMSLHAVIAAYAQKHGKRPPSGFRDNLTDTCPLYRKWLLREPGK